VWSFWGGAQGAERGPLAVSDTGFKTFVTLVRGPDPLASSLCCENKTMVVMVMMLSAVGRGSRRGLCWRRVWSEGGPGPGRAAWRCLSADTAASPSWPSPSRMVRNCDVTNQVVERVSIDTIDRARGIGKSGDIGRGVCGLT
jgi:hypothetical protein